MFYFHNTITESKEKYGNEAEWREKILEAIAEDESTEGTTKDASVVDFYTLQRPIGRSVNILKLKPLRSNIRHQYFVMELKKNNGKICFLSLDKAPDGISAYYGSSYESVVKMYKGKIRYIPLLVDLYRTYNPFEFLQQQNLSTLLTNLGEILTYDLWYSDSKTFTKEMTERHDVGVWKSLQELNLPQINHLVDITYGRSFVELMSSSDPTIRELYLAVIWQVCCVPPSLRVKIKEISKIADIFSSFEDIIQYSKALREGTIDDTYIKLFVVGQTGNGKSSLCNALKEGTAYYDSPDKTILLDIHEMKLTAEINLRLFDAGGDSEYYLISSLFLHSDCVFVIVVDGTKYANEFFQQQIGVYLDIIVSGCQKGYLFIIVTKRDDENHYKFSGTHKNHINVQVRDFLDRHKSVLVFNEESILEFSAQKVEDVEMLIKILENRILMDVDILQTRTLPYKWAKFVESFDQNMMEYSNIKDLYSKYSFETIEGAPFLGHKSILHEYDLKKFEELMSENRGRFPDDSNDAEVSGNIAKDSKGTQNEDKKEKTKKEDKKEKTKEEYKTKKAKKEHISENARKEHKTEIARKENKTKETNKEMKLIESHYAVDTILRFFRNHGQLIWLENVKEWVFPNPSFLLDFLRVLIRHNQDEYLTDLTPHSRMEILDRGLICLEDVKILLKKGRFNPDNDWKILITILTELGLATSANKHDERWFVPAMIKNEKHLDDIKKEEVDIQKNHKNVLTAEIRMNKCGSAGIYDRTLVKLYQHEFKHERLRHQNIENRTNGVVSGVKGSVSMAGKKDKERYEYLMVEKVHIMDDVNGKYTRELGGENARIGNFRTITLYIRPKNEYISQLWEIVRMFRDVISEQISSILKAEYRIYCYQCWKMNGKGYFRADDHFRINCDYCSDEEIKHSVGEVVEENIWIYDPAYEGQILNLFTKQNIKNYEPKRPLNDLRNYLKPGDQIWCYRAPGENCLSRGNAYAHVMVYVGKNEREEDEVVHVHKSKSSRVLVAKIKKHLLEQAISEEDRKKPIFFLGHEVLRSEPLANEKRLICKKALACVKHGKYKTIKFNYDPLENNCETFANALLGADCRCDVPKYCEQASGLNPEIKRTQKVAKLLTTCLSPTYPLLIDQIKKRLEMTENEWNK